MQQRVAVVIALGLSVLAFACSDGADRVLLRTDAPSGTPSPSRVTPSPAPSPPVVLTASQTPVVQSEMQMDDFRVFSADVDQALRAGDVDFFVQRISGTMKCDANMRYGVGHMCHGLAGGAEVKGVNLVMGDVVSFLTVESFTERMNEYFGGGSRGLFAWAARAGRFAAILETGSAVLPYTVMPGDTLQGIAEEELGFAARWEEIYALNNAAVGDDVRNIVPGQQLIMPDEGLRLYFTPAGAGWGLVAEDLGGCPFAACAVDDHWERWQGGTE